MTKEPLKFKSTASQQAQSLLNACLASATVGVLIVDRSERVVQTNGRLLDLLRIAPQQASAATTLQELLAPARDRIEDWDDFVADLSYLADQPGEERLGETLHLNDGTVLARSTRPVWGDDGMIIGRIWEWEDQTDHFVTRRALQRLENHARETEKELERLRKEHTEIESSLEQAQRSDSLALFADGVGHDFNNLLVGMLGNISIAQSEIDADGALSELLEQIRDAGIAASELVNEILIFAGRSQPQPEHHDVSQMIDDTFPILHSAVHNDCALELELAMMLPQVKIDATRIRQLLVNLVTNGSEALRGEMGTVTISTVAEDLTAERIAAARLGSDFEPGRYVAIRVKDTGSGIETGVERDMFEPFFTTRLCARGLGLSAARSILEEHQGVMEVHSHPGGGTTMTAWLPAEAGRTVSPAPVDDTAEDAAWGWKGTGRVLFVDDNFTVLEVGSRMLEMLGFDVETFQSGFDAVEELRQRPEDFDLAIVDLTMPQMDGSETSQQLKAVKPDMPVVLSSGYNSAEVKSRSVGCDGFLRKPYSLQELRLELRALDRRENADWLA